MPAHARVELQAEAQETHSAETGLRQLNWSIPREWDGETAVCFGGGPSLNQSDVDYCIARGWRRIACNDAFLLDPYADVLCFADERWHEWHGEELRDFKGKYIIAWKKVQPVRGVTIRFLRHQRGILSLIPSTIMGKNTGQAALNIAYLFGVKRILLLGYDMRGVNGKYNWHDRHRGQAGPNSTWLPRRSAEHQDERYKFRFIPAMEHTGKALARKGVEIVNCTEGSALTAFAFSELQAIS